MDSAVFEDFIEELLPLCGKWPQPKSVLVIDNASFHHTERITQMLRTGQLANGRLAKGHLALGT
jgi:hypothetical protein